MSHPSSDFVNIGKMVDKTDRQLGDEMHQRMNNEAEKLKQREIDLAERVKEARRYLDESADRFKALWLDWIDDSKKAIEDSRLTRLALEEEARRIHAAVRDMREVFEQHKGITGEVADFVSSLERLHALEQAGFFNRMQEIMIKLMP